MPAPRHAASHPITLGPLFLRPMAVAAACEASAEAAIADDAARSRDAEEEDARLTRELGKAMDATLRENEFPYEKHRADALCTPRHGPPVNDAIGSRYGNAALRYKACLGGRVGGFGGGRRKSLGVELEISKMRKGRRGGG